MSVVNILHISQMSLMLKKLRLSPLFLQKLIVVYIKHLFSFNSADIFLAAQWNHFAVNWPLGILLNSDFVHSNIVL